MRRIAQDQITFISFAQKLCQTRGEILAEIGPKLLDEYEQLLLGKHLALTTVGRRYEELNINGILRATILDPDVKKDATIYDLDVDTHGDSLDSVILQLSALGLIVRSERKRPVSDRGTYWTLTPFGRQEAIKVRAEPRPTIPRRPSDTPLPPASDGSAL